jgi:hypothetical protein
VGLFDRAAARLNQSLFLRVAAQLWRKRFNNLRPTQAVNNYIVKQGAFEKHISGNRPTRF